MRIVTTTKKIPQIVRRNVYGLEIKFMSGDADSYETREILALESHLLPIIRFLTAMDAVGPYGEHRRLEDTAYCKIKDLDCAFVANDDAERPADVPSDARGIDWPSDVLTDGQCRASLDRWEVYWYDHEGNKFKCEVQP